MAMNFRFCARTFLIHFDGFIGRCILCLIANTFAVFSGCDQASGLNMLFHSKTFHQKFELHAEAFFEDPNVRDLCNAIERDDIDAVKQCIASGVDIKAIGKHGVTPLFWAYPDNKLDIFTLLLENGADPNVRITSDLNLPKVFRAGDSVVHLAARSQFPSQFFAVMKHGGDPNLPGRHDDPVLHEIIKGGVPNSIERIKVAVERGGDVNAVDHLGNTPISTAVSRFGQFTLAKKLLELGADPTHLSNESLGTTIHDVLAFKNSIDAGHSPKLQGEYELMIDFIQTLRDKGFDVDEAQEDVDRWAQLAKKKPGNPGWFINSEIEHLKKRALAKGNAKIVPNEKLTDD